MISQALLYRKKDLFAEKKSPFQHFFQEKTTPFHEPIGNLRDLSSGLILWDLRVVIFKFSAFPSDAIRNISG
jgi:hypothetical protein